MDVRRFATIEGLRGWLAMTVVLSHIATFTSIYAHGLGPRIANAGVGAVTVFMVISGFVITHLIVERPEPYGVYLLRRFARIFPLFFVMCVVAFFTNDVLIDALTLAPWSSEPDFFLVTAREIVASENQFFWSNALAHLLLLHGAISNNLIPLAPFTFVGPGWSLSLEWQFYLLAPLAVMFATRSLRWLTFVASVVAVGELASQVGLFGKFWPSFLPEVAGFFALGIASRLCLPYVSSASWNAVCAMGLAIVSGMAIMIVPLVGNDAVAVIVWAFIFIGLTLDDRQIKGTYFSRLYRMLEGQLSAYLGSRSYSIYLSHSAVIAICLRLWFYYFPTASKTVTFFGLVSIAVPLTLIFSEALYRSIELPGIAAGSVLASSLRNHRHYRSIQSSG
jgi:peptidoglycan/LPS O-acetylase OafA/YrhL